MADRRTEKKIGTRNEMHVVEQSEFPVYEGKHEAIISEEIGISRRRNGKSMLIGVRRSTILPMHIFCPAF